jgi:hypothetical protein
LYVETAAVIGLAMTDYLLAAGTNKAPATRAPEHMAAWLETRGYRLVRSPATGPADPGDPGLVARIAAAIDWRSLAYDTCTRHAIIRQVLTAVDTADSLGAGSPRAA